MDLVSLHQMRFNQPIMLTQLGLPLPLLHIKYVGKKIKRVKIFMWKHVRQDQTSLGKKAVIKLVFVVHQEMERNVLGTLKNPHVEHVSPMRETMMTTKQVHVRRSSDRAQHEYS